MPILPDCNRQAVSCSPLEGDCRPRADELQTGPARVRFFSFCRSYSAGYAPGASFPRRSRCREVARQVSKECSTGACTTAPVDLSCRRSINAKEDDQWPGQLRPSSRSASASRSTATCRLSSDLDPFASGLNGAPHRHRARFGGRGWFSSMELSLPDMPIGVGG